MSRTAISKWESGRGYPNIESLKEISKFFSITIDELSSGDELLSVAEEDNHLRQRNSRSIYFDLIDISVSALFFLPFFGQKADGAIRSVPLLFLMEFQIISRLHITYSQSE